MFSSITICPMVINWPTNIFIDLDISLFQTGLSATGYFSVTLQNQFAKNRFAIQTPGLNG